MFISILDIYLLRPRPLERLTEGIFSATCAMLCTASATKSGWPCQET